MAWTTNLLLWLYCMLWWTIFFLSNIGSGRYPDIERVNTDRSLSLWSSSLSVSLPLYQPHQSIFICLVSIMARLNGLSSPHSLFFSPQFFTISCPTPLLYSSLFGNAVHLALPLALSLSFYPHLPCSYPSVQSSVSKRLVVGCCAKQSAQIWITAVWRYVWDNGCSHFAPGLAANHQCVNVSVCVCVCSRYLWSVLLWL